MDLIQSKVGGVTVAIIPQGMNFGHHRTLMIIWKCSREEQMIITHAKSKGS